MFDHSLHTLIAPTVIALGYELIGVEKLPQGRKGSLVRVIIDTPEGITLTDCERVSYQVSGLLDVEDPIPGHYTLEISSPGIDRPLVTLEHYTRFIGQTVSIRLSRPLDTRRNFTGQLQKVEGETIILLCDGTEYCLPYNAIEKARLVPEALNF